MIRGVTWSGWGAGILLVSTLTGFAEPARNVIICLGDGMGWEQIRAGEYFLGRQAVFKSFPCTGVVETFQVDTNDYPETDSSAAATAIFTGHRVNYDTVGIADPPDPGYTAGQEYQNICEFMQARGKSIGSLSTCFINDATPAAFAAHEISRSRYAEILDDFFQQTRPNLIWGGGATNYTMTPQQALDAGYSVVTTRVDLLALPTNSADIYSCGLFGPSTMGYEYDGMGNLPHLTDMALKAIDILDKDPDGFCLLVEGGEIDLGCHIGDLNRMTGEVVEFDRMVSNVMAWANSRTDTLVVVCADHETGGLTNLVSNGAGNYPSGNFTTSYHTTRKVPAFAWGAGASNLIGVQHLTNIYRVLTGGLPPPAPTTLATWTAYNDFSWQSGQPTNRVTLYGSNNASGSLVDYATGQTLPATLSISGAIISETTNLVPLPAGSDAESVFSGKASEDGYRYWNSGSVDLLVSGLDPAGVYTVALYGDRGQAAYTYRWNDTTLLDASTYSNTSSAGSTIFTTATSNDSTRILAANTNGQLARFSTIQPGPDGDFVIRITAGGSSSTSAYINCLLLSSTSNATPAPAVELLPSGSTWRYLDTGTNAGSSWRESGYADSGWASGPAPLGYGNSVTAVLATTTSYGTNAANKPITTYFRKSIVINNTALLSNVTFRAQFDDGAVVYVNNTPVWTYNLPTSGVTHLTQALSGIGAGNETSVLGQAISPAAFVNGTNWIAVEVHQVTNTSSDTFFHLWATNLIGTTNATYAADADGDGLDDTWETTYFGGTSASNGAPAQDPDGDGMDNQSEYRAGTDPTSSASKLILTGIVTTNAPGVYGLAWQSVYGKRYDIQSATNLATTWSNEATNIIAVGPNINHTVTANQPRAFWRIKVE